MGVKLKLPEKGEQKETILATTARKCLSVESSNLKSSMVPHLRGEVKVEPSTRPGTTFNLAERDTKGKIGSNT